MKVPRTQVNPIPEVTRTVRNTRSSRIYMNVTIRYFRKFIT